MLRHPGRYPFSPTPVPVIDSLGPHLQLDPVTFADRSVHGLPHGRTLTRDVALKLVKIIDRPGLQGKTHTQMKIISPLCRHFLAESLGDLESVRINEYGSQSSPGRHVPTMFAASSRVFDQQLRTVPLKEIERPSDPLVCRPPRVTFQKIELA